MDIVGHGKVEHLADLEPLIVRPLPIKEKALKGGRESSGAPSWTKAPLVRRRDRYFDRGICEGWRGLISQYNIGTGSEQILR